VGIDRFIVGWNQHVLPVAIGQRKAVGKAHLTVSRSGAALCGMTVAVETPMLPWPAIPATNRCPACTMLAKRSAAA
jgi:hypothetical protein